MKVLRTLPDLNAKEILKLTVKLLQKLPEDLYDMLVRHPYGIIPFFCLLSFFYNVSFLLDPMINDFILPEFQDDD